jgi:predicted phosphate transport protein (TIGR00153 family)
MAFRLIPKEERFYDDFTAMAEQIRVGAVLLDEMLAPDRPIWDKADEIKEVEHKCDFLTHEIIQRLNRTFVTPLDREDIHALAGSLDDVMDAIDAAAAVIRLYKITHVRNGARRLADIVCDSVDRVVEAIGALEKKDGVLELAARVSQLEHEADRVHQDSIVELFDQESDPIAVIKWKEIFDFLEAATDRCEDVANLLEGVVVKNG